MMGAIIRCTLFVDIATKQMNSVGDVVIVQNVAVVMKMTRFVINSYHYDFSASHEIDNIILMDDSSIQPVFGSFNHPTVIDYYSFKRFIEQSLDFLAKNKATLTENDHLLSAIIDQWQTSRLTFLQKCKLLQKEEE